ncbi:tripartite-type tricarboxylate transporter receptor subunit TctC [Novosphingobium kunmingense]|uniref:Tripartite-type tricarboxylate transporter receptor subunit TctC n=1 Tax=Novosphingobium kunmingense TaxID=1211806 RepID=A0A2N0H3D9_9SPHN|nr:tripartite tricarboxylate transporter substrate-binding protein [Novosphingobium kunmingense]PKB13453.1 tripartite-type tricarboxylate transporter receptor subunit TctC [Novosphingobium kunmingense]
MSYFARGLAISSRLQRALAALVLAWSLLASPAHAGAPQERLTLVVPGAVGGGWDLTAKAMKDSLEREGIVRSVEIVRYPGTGGLVGLAQFVAHHRGQDDVLLVGGLTMLGAALTDSAAISLRDVTPVARLAGDWGLIAVPANSPIKDIEDLKRTMRSGPGGLRWSGGALGSSDQALVWSMASQLGVPLDNVLYYGKVGGRNAAEMLMSNRADVAVSGFAEFAPHLKSGRLRAIAIDAPRRFAEVDVPTLRESGIDVSMMNWRGVFGAPGLTIAQQDRLSALIVAMERSSTWRARIAQSHWTPAYLDPAAFSRFIDRESSRWPALVNPPMRTGNEVFVAEAQLPQGLLWSLAGLAMALATAAGKLLIRLRERQRIEQDLKLRCGELSSKLEEAKSARSAVVLEGIKDDFGEWNLSFAERDVAWFMLRGLPLKQIATLRGTSERTVRQQAQAIYRKAGLESRSDLAGRVLERFI